MSGVGCSGRASTACANAPSDPPEHAQLLTSLGPIRSYTKELGPLLWPAAPLHYPAGCYCASPVHVPAPVFGLWCSMAWYD